MCVCVCVCSWVRPGADLKRSNLYSTGSHRLKYPAQGHKVMMYECRDHHRNVSPGRDGNRKEEEYETWWTGPSNCLHSTSVKHWNLGLLLYILKNVWFRFLLLCVRNHTLDFVTSPFNTDSQRGLKKIYPFSIHLIPAWMSNSAF